MNKKLKIFGIAAYVIIAMVLGIIWKLFLENFTEEKLRYEFLDLKNRTVLLRWIIEISECKNYNEGCGGTYKINGNVTFIKSAEKVSGPQWQKLCRPENCSMIKVTANDSLPIVVNKGDHGYGAMKKPNINNMSTFNETKNK